MKSVAYFLAICAIAFAAGEEAPATPPFLETASAAVKADFVKLSASFDGSLSDDQEEAKVSAFVKTQSPAIQKAYVDFVKAAGEEDKKQAQFFATLRTKMSDASKPIHDKYVKLVTDNSIPKKDKDAKIQALIKDTQDNHPAEDKELRKLLEENTPKA